MLEIQYYEPIRHPAPPELIESIKKAASPEAPEGAIIEIGNWSMLLLVPEREMVQESWEWEDVLQDGGYVPDDLTLRALCQKWYKLKLDGQYYGVGITYHKPYC
jgi:hypothetical protein